MTRTTTATQKIAIHGAPLTDDIFAQAKSEKIDSRELLEAVLGKPNSLSERWQDAAAHIRDAYAECFSELNNQSNPDKEFTEQAKATLHNDWHNITVQYFSRTRKAIQEKLNEKGYTLPVDVPANAETQDKGLDNSLNSQTMNTSAKVIAGVSAATALGAGAKAADSWVNRTGGRSQVALGSDQLNQAEASSKRKNIKKALVFATVAAVGVAGVVMAFRMGKNGPSANQQR